MTTRKSTRVLKLLMTSLAVDNECNAFKTIFQVKNEKDLKDPFKFCSIQLHYIQLFTQCDLPPNLSRVLIAASDSKSPCAMEAVNLWGGMRRCRWRFLCTVCYLWYILKDFCSPRLGLVNMQCLLCCILNIHEMLATLCTKVNSG